MKLLKIEKIGIITKRNNEHYQNLIMKLVDYLKKKKKQVFFDSNTNKYFKGEQGYNKEILLSKVELAIVLGGDGTILKTARRMQRRTRSKKVVPAKCGGVQQVSKPAVFFYRPASNQRGRPRRYERKGRFSRAGLGPAVFLSPIQNLERRDAKYLAWTPMAIHTSRTQVRKNCGRHENA